MVTQVQSVREKMIRRRQELGLSLKQKAQFIGISENLLGLVEAGSVTSPSIAKRIGESYDLNNLEIEELMPPNRRPSSYEYDPEKFVDRAYNHMKRDQLPPRVDLDV